MVSHMGRKGDWAVRRREGALARDLSAEGRMTCSHLRIAEAVDIRIRLKAKKVPDGFRSVRDRSREVSS